MDPTATTIVTQLINEGRQQHGRIEAIAVPQDLFDKVLDEVVAAGGVVEFEACEVDGVRVQPGATSQGVPLVTPSGSEEAVPLARA